MTDRQLIRGTSSFTSAAAKWGSLGRASGVYNISNSTGFWTNNANIPDSTIECWFKTSSATALGGSSTQMLLARYKYYWLGLDSQGVNLYYGLDSAVNNNPAHGALIFPGALCDGQWHHVAAVFSGGAGTAYCDGVRLGSDVATPVGTGTDIEVIGGYGNTSEAYEWSGAIDEVRYSNVARYSGATYTVPTGPFAVDVNTVALFHMEGSLLDATLAVAPPVPAFTFTVTGPTVTFDASSSASADVPIDGWLWDFGDGTSGSGQTVVHTYTAGTYTVTLTEVTSGFTSAAVSHSVTVSAGLKTSTIPAATDALIATIKASNVITVDTVVTDGAWDTSNTPDELVAIGLAALSGSEESGSGVQAPRTMGLALRVDEDYTLVCEVFCWTGDTTGQKAMRDRAFALLAVVETALRTNPTLSQTITSGGAWVESVQLVQVDENITTGRFARIHFDVHVKNVLTS